MKLTTGFDLSEDVFPFLENFVFFDEPDDNRQDIYESLVDTAQVSFTDNDLETALNYDRLIGEIKRSIIVSPKKYRNRIVYPKVFARTFCIFIDPNEFEVMPDKEDEDSDATFTVLDGTISDEYTQYYVTIKLLPDFTSPGAYTEYSYSVFTATEAE